MITKPQNFGHISARGLTLKNFVQAAISLRFSDPDVESLADSLSQMFLHVRRGSGGFGFHKLGVVFLEDDIRDEDGDDAATFRALEESCAAVGASLCHPEVAYYLHLDYPTWLLVRAVNALKPEGCDEIDSLIIFNPVAQNGSSPIRLFALSSTDKAGMTGQSLWAASPASYLSKGSALIVGLPMSPGDSYEPLRL